MSLTITEELTAALKRVRDDNTPDDYCVASYSDETTLTVAGSGEGGVSALKSHFHQDDICYALLRKAFVWEKVGTVQTDTIKFIFVIFRPSGIPLKRKMKIGGFEGAIKKAFSSYQCDLDIDSEDELSDEIIDELMKKITMTADKTTEKKGNSMFLGGSRLSWRKGADDAQKAKKPVDSRNEFKVVAGASVTFDSEEELKAAIADVRADSSSTRWCLASYTGKATIGLTATGDGDVSEMLSHCNESTAAYGLFRISEQYDQTVATKFCFVAWSPDHVSPMQRAKIATHRGVVQPFFRPFHEQFAISEADELTEDIALERISGLTGTRSHVTDRKVEKKKSVYQRKMLGGVKGETQKLEFKDKEELLVSIADVRSDSSATNWCAAALEGEKKDLKLAPAGSGSGGINEMVDAFDEGKVMFGLLRNEEVYDRSTTVKFYYFQWVGAAVPPQTKGYAGAVTGAVTAVFPASHDTITGDSVEEIISNANRRIKNLNA